MKTNLFKSLLLMVLACLSLVSCKKDEPENPLLFDAAYMQGLWNVYEDAAYGKKDLNVYFRFTSDGKSESYEKSNSDKYTYRTGSFVIENKWLRLTHKTSRHFHTIEGVDRYVADFKGSEAYWFVESYYLDTVMNNDIRIKVNGTTLYMRKVNDLPAYWKTEYSETEMAASATNILGQWDLCDRFTIKGSNYNYSYTYNPATQGMILKENGVLNNFNFWANQVWNRENNAGRVASDQNVRLQNADCAWILNGKKLTLTCASYIILSYDADKNISGQERVTPDEPIQMDYQIYTYTSKWMILYSVWDNTYYAFRKAAQTSSAPRKMVISSPDK